MSRAIKQDKTRYESEILHDLRYYHNYLSFALCGRIWLKHPEFESLTIKNDTNPRDGWLDMEVIEFHLKVMLPKIQAEHGVTQKIKLMSLRTTQHLFFDVYKFNSMKPLVKNCYTDESIDYLLLPVLDNGHYYSIIIDQKSKLFYLMDSGGSGSRLANTMMERFTRRTMSKKIYTAVSVAVQKQKDTNSCGIFTISNTISFVKWLSSNEFELQIPEIDVILMRQQIRNEILSFSDCILNICPRCITVAVDASFTCYVCSRNMHIECSQALT